MTPLKGFFLAITMLFAGILDASIHIEYYNKDSKDYEFNVKTCGSSTTVEFDHSRTSSVTIQSGCNEAVISTSCGKVTVKDGDKVVISNGCIKIE